MEDHKNTFDIDTSALEVYREMMCHTVQNFRARLTEAMDRFMARPITIRVD